MSSFDLWGYAHNPLIKPVEQWPGKLDLDKDSGQWQSFTSKIVPEDIGSVINYNLREKDGFYLVEVALPGVDKDDVDVTLNNNTLTVSGGNADYEHGLVSKFSKSFTLPFYVEDDVENIEASLQNGVLTVKLPIRTRDKSGGKKIKVK